MAKLGNLILIGSNSVHTLRYLNAISNCFRKIIFITNNSDNIELPDNVEPHNINFKLSNLKARFQIAKIIRPYPNIIIHIQQANSYAFHTLRAIKYANLPCKTILTAWGSDVLILPHQSRLLKAMVKFNLSNSNIITSDSLYMSAQIKQLCPSVGELHTINFGIRNFPDELKLSQKEDLILSNRLHKPLYNIDKIIIAFAKLSKYKKLKLVVAASGSETDKLKQLAIELGIKTEQIIFTGMLSYTELLEWYRKAKYFVSIPSSDATSLSVLEAMGYGCYPILSNLPANLEWVINEINGIINQESSSLFSDIEQAINLSSEKYSAALKFNYELIKQKAIFEDNIQKFLKLYG